MRPGKATRTRRRDENAVADVVVDVRLIHDRVRERVSRLEVDPVLGEAVDLRVKDLHALGLEDPNPVHAGAEAVDVQPLEHDLVGRRGIDDDGVRTGHEHAALGVLALDRHRLRDRHAAEAAWIEAVDLAARGGLRDRTRECLARSGAATWVGIVADARDPRARGLGGGGGRERQRYQRKRRDKLGESAAWGTHMGSSGSEKKPEASLKAIRRWCKPPDRPIPSSSASDGRVPLHAAAVAAAGRLDAEVTGDGLRAATEPPADVDGAVLVRAAVGEGDAPVGLDAEPVALLGLPERDVVQGRPAGGIPAPEVEGHELDALARDVEDELVVAVVLAAGFRGLDLPLAARASGRGRDSGRRDGEGYRGEDGGESRD